MEIYLVKLTKTITNQQKPKLLLMVIVSNMKAKETKIKIYHLKNIFIWSDHVTRYDKWL